MMKNGLALILVFVFSIVSVSAYDFVSLDFSQKNIEPQIDKLDIDPLYHTIGDVQISLIEETVLDVSTAKSAASIGDIVMTIERLIALGKKIWEIIDAGRPVIEANLNPISVLPNVDDPTFAFSRMYGWSLPVVRRYQVVYKNLYGGKVVEFEFMVLFQHSGQLDGKGSYLTGVNVVADTISVAWGFTFKANSKLMAISNRGTLDDPVAAATIQLNYLAHSAFKEIQSSVLFHLDGQGNIIKL